MSAGLAEAALWALAALFLLYLPVQFILRGLRRKREEELRAGLPKRIRSVLARDPGQAHRLFLDFRALGGKPDGFSAEEIYRIFAGHAEELTAQSASLSEEQLLGVAKLLSAENKRLEAVR